MACSVFGVETVEEAPFQSVKKDDTFEIRDYASYVVAETRVEADFREAGNKAFRKLFRYISGDNTSSEKIAMTAPVIAESGGDDTGEKISMTAPVIAEQEGEAWLYRFVLPSKFNIDNAPQPLNPDVVLVEVPEKRVATIRYSGLSSDKVRAKKAEELVNWIEEQGLEMTSGPRWAGYNAPFTLPPLRRNEILIELLHDHGATSSKSMR